MLTGLHLLLTYRCPFECDHCFLRCGPRSEGTFTLDRVRTVIAEARRIKTIEWIWFEGGEPFLYHPLLLAAVRFAAERGFKLGAVTNGWFAESPEDAALWLGPLRKAGLESLSVSDDAFHGGGCDDDDDDTPAKRTLAAAKALGLSTGSISVPDPREEEGVVFRGRAADKLTAGLPRRPLATFTACGDEDLADPGRVHLDPFGHVHACQGVLMGNFLAEPLSKIVEGWDARRDPVCGPLLAGGPAALAKAFDLPAAPEGYVSACHACFELRRALRERCPGQLGPEQVYEG